MEDGVRVNLKSFAYIVGNTLVVSFPIIWAMTSTGTGNMTVLLFSAAMLFRV